MKINKVAEILFDYDLNNPIVYSIIMIEDMQRWTDESEWETLKSVKQLVKNLKYLEKKYNTKFDYESLKSLNNSNRLYRKNHIVYFYQKVYHYLFCYLDRVEYQLNNLIPLLLIF